MENIVGVVLIISAPVWALLGLLVHFCVDKPHLKRLLKALDKTDLGEWVATTSWVSMKKVSQHLLKYSSVTALFTAHPP